MNQDDILRQVRESAKRRVLFLPHAIRQMTRPSTMITTSEVETVVQAGILIEDYPEDQRGHSCLLLGFVLEQRPIHVVCAPKADYLAIITTYIPTPSKWTSDFKKRL